MSTQVLEPGRLPFDALTVEVDERELPFSSHDSSVSPTGIDF